MLATSRYLVITRDIIIPVVTLLGILVSIWVIFFSRVFAISDIVCTADYKPCENGSVQVEVEKAKGNNLFRYDPRGLEERLAKGDFMIKSVKIDKKLPGTLEISTISVNPTVSFRLVGSSGSWVVCDDKGRVIGVRDNDPNVPTILVSSLLTVRVGQVLDGEKYQSAENLAVSLSKSSIEYTSIALLDEISLSVGLKTGQTALLTTTRDIDTQLSALHAILLDATIKKETYKTIDVRFSQAILRQN